MRSAALRGLIVVLLAGPLLAQNYDVISLAGPGQAADSIPADAAYFRRPASLARDKSGTIYVADASDHRILKILSSGGVATVAGKVGVTGFSGDGGAATEALLDTPTAIVFDKQGNLIIADSGNYRIRRIRPDGRIETIAGTGALGKAGDGGPASQASLGIIVALAMDDSGNLLIGDALNVIVRCMAPDGTISKIAGIGRRGDLFIPRDALTVDLLNVVALAAAGGKDYFIAYQCGVTKVTQGIIDAYAGTACGNVADGGWATWAGFYSVQAVTMAKNGVLYVGQATRVRTVNADPDPAKRFLSTAYGVDQPGDFGDGGPAPLARFGSIRSLLPDDQGQMTIADAGNRRVRQVDSTGVIQTISGLPWNRTGDQGPATAAVLHEPTAVVYGKDGSILVADLADYRVRRIAPDGTITTIAGTGKPGPTKPGFKATESPVDPRSLAVDANGLVYIGMWDGIYRIEANGVLQRFAGDGSDRSRVEGSSAKAASVMDVEGLVFDTRGSLYFSETLKFDVGRVSPDGRIYAVTGTRGAGPGSVTENVPATSAQVAYPTSLSFDAQGSLYITDTGNRRIRKIDTSQIITTVAGNGESIPAVESAYAVNASIGGPIDARMGPDGALWITDSLNRRLYRVDSKGKISTVVRGRRWDFSAGSALLLNPGAMAMGVQGQILVADTVSHRILQLTLATTPPCAYQVTPTALSGVPPAGTGGTISVTTATGCAWTAVSDQSWIHFSAPASGTGSGTLTYQIDANLTIVARTGTITIAGIAINANQGGAPPPPSITVGGIVNAAGYQAVIAPLSYVSIYGSNLAPPGTNTTWDDVLTPGATALPTRLAGISVKVAGKEAAVYAVNAAAGVVNILVPGGIPAGTVNVELTTDNGTALANVALQARSPAWFAYLLNGKLYPCALLANTYTYVAPVGALSGVTSRPARAGDYITLFANGLGSADRALSGLEVIPPGIYYPIADLLQVSVTIAGTPVNVLFAGMTYTGLWQVNIQLPNGLPSGDQPIFVEAGGVRSPAGPVLSLE